MALDLPIDDIMPYIDDAMEQIGVPCYIDGYYTKIMISDLERVYSDLQANSKLAVVRKSVPFVRGSSVHFTDDDSHAIVFSEPVDDIVSYSCQILRYNAFIKIEETKYNQYDKETGDIIYQESFSEPTLIHGYCEKTGGSENFHNAGRSSVSELLLVTSSKVEVALGNIASILYDGDSLNNTKFRITDIDDVTSGLFRIKLVSV